MAAPQTITLAFTGASGMPYGLRLLECLLAAELPRLPALLGGGADRREAGMRSRASRRSRARRTRFFARALRRARRPAHACSAARTGWRRSRPARIPPTRWRSARAAWARSAADRLRPRRQPDRARGRRDAEGAPAARAGAARDAAVGDPSREHAAARARRRRDPAAGTGLLRPAAIGRRVDFVVARVLDDCVVGRLPRWPSSLPLPVSIKQSMLEINDAEVRLTVLRAFLKQHDLR